MMQSRFMLTRTILGLALGLFATQGCGSGAGGSCESPLSIGTAAIGPMKCGGGPTAPSAAVVSSVARKPAGAALTSHLMKAESAAQACGASNVGKCGCLAPASWYSDGSNIYDFVCCDAAGSAYSLYSCGDSYNCDDFGTDVVCTLNGAP
jgi:hypothetical protein